MFSKKRAAYKVPHLQDTDLPMARLKVRLPFCSAGAHRDINYPLAYKVIESQQMPNVLIYKPLLINLIQNRISYCMSATSLVITLTEKQINVLIIFQGKPRYCSIQFSQHLGDVTEKQWFTTTQSRSSPQGRLLLQSCGSAGENIPFSQSGSAASDSTE